MTDGIKCKAACYEAFNNCDRPGESGVGCISDPTEAEAHDAG